MRKMTISLLLLASVGPGWTQSAQPPANRDATTPAINSPNSPPNPGAPVAGANSFTEGQAKSRIEDKGFTNVSDLKKDEIPQYCAMINVDTLGLSPPQVANNMSSRKLAQFTEDLAKEMKMPFARASIPGADSDSSSFVAKKIPAVTIHGMNNEWPKILHSSNDQSAKVNPGSVYLGYRLVLAMVVRLDQSPCDAYK